jgi:diguanylate cyclase (GGDEF)-like protein/PAS domain S-box-containing protein
LEIAVLRQEIESIHEKQGPSSDGEAKCAFCATLVNEVPEYLYSVEFVKGEISTVFHSPQCQEITGYSPADYVANPSLWKDMIHKDDLDRVWTFLKSLREPLHCRSIEHRIIHKDGSVRWVLNMSTVHLDIDGSTLRQSGFLIDVTGRRQKEEENIRLLNETRQNSFTDDLTQLFNRRAFKVLAEQQVRVAVRINHSVLLFFIDVDRLKYVNDTFGHRAGDELLRGLGVILKCAFRESDIIARIGGDEFAVLSMETGPNSRELLLDRLRATIEARNSERNGGSNLSVSVGVSRYNLNESDSLAGLLDRADKDMYARKTEKTTANNILVNCS